MTVYTVYKSARFNNAKFIIINERLKQNHYLPIWQFT